MGLKDRLSLPRHILGLALMLLIVAASATAHAGNTPSLGTTVTTISTTIPSNGDLNPYGVAVVPVTMGNLVQGRFLVSNFNNGANKQGLGTTIVQIAPDGTFSLFAQIDPSKVSCTGGVGLTTALVALHSGLVIVGSLPTTDGTSATAQAGCLIVLDSSGNVITTFTGNNINGPWDMTALDGGQFVVLFVTNVLNDTVAKSPSVVNTATVVRLLISTSDTPKLLDSTVIANAFPARTDPTALVIGPTGVAFDAFTGILYVADTLDSRIAAIPSALFRMTPTATGDTVSQGGALNGPLGLALAQNHHLVSANGGDGNIVETNPHNGKQLKVQLVDNTGGPPPGAGALFGLAAVVSNSVYFVDDNANTFNLLH